MWPTSPPPSPPPSCLHLYLSHITSLPHITSHCLLLHNICKLHNFPSENRNWVCMWQSFHGLGVNWREITEYFFTYFMQPVPYVTCNNLAYNYWWLVRVTLVVAWWLFAPKFWEVAGTYESLFCSKMNAASVVVTCEVMGTLNLYKMVKKLNFVHLEVVGT